MAWFHIGKPYLYTTGIAHEGRINTLGNDHVRGYPFIRQDDSRDVGQIASILVIFLMESGKVTDIKCATLHSTNPDDSRCVSSRGIAGKQGCNVKRLSTPPGLPVAYTPNSPSTTLVFVELLVCTLRTPKCPRKTNVSFGYLGLAYDLQVS